MKKILVVLLVLAVAGGASAQWSTWSGSSSLSTTIDMGKFDPVTIDGGLSISAGLRYDLAKNNWTVALPFKISDGDGVELAGASVGYTNGPIAISIPFGISLTYEDMSTGWGHNNWGRGMTEILKEMHLRASFTRDTYAFGFGVDSIFGRYDDDFDPNYVNKVAIGETYGGPRDPSVWGWYDLWGGRIKMAVSYGGGYATEWWRASTIVLQGHTEFWDGDTSVGYRRGWAMDGDKLDEDGDDLFFENFGFDLKWGNIADSGFAMRFNITPSFNLGFAFAGSLMFDDTHSKAASNKPFDGEGDGIGWNFGHNFLKTFLLGVGFDNGKIAVSGMFGFLPADDSVDMQLHAGFGFKINDNMSLGADLSMVSFGGFDAFSLNVGASFDMKLDFGLFANFKIAATDLLSEFEGAPAGSDFTGQTVKAELGDQPGPAGILNQGLQLGLGLQVGYAIDLNSYLNLSVTAGLAMAYGKLTDGLERLYFALTPVFTWNLIENGSIVFEYTIGYETVGEEFTNKLGVSFKWSF